MRRAFTLQLAEVPDDLTLPAPDPDDNTAAQEAEHHRQLMFYHLRRRIVLLGERWLQQDGKDNDIWGSFFYDWMTDSRLPQVTEVSVTPVEDCPCNACDLNSSTAMTHADRTTAFHLHWVKGGIMRSVGIVTRRPVLPRVDVRRDWEPADSLDTEHDIRMAMQMTLDDVLHKSVIIGATGPQVTRQIKASVRRILSERSSECHLKDVTVLYDGGSSLQTYQCVAIYAGVGELHKYEVARITPSLW